MGAWNSVNFDYVGNGNIGDDKAVIVRFKPKNCAMYVSSGPGCNVVSVPPGFPPGSWTDFTGCHCESGGCSWDTTTMGCVALHNSMFIPGGEYYGTIPAGGGPGFSIGDHLVVSDVFGNGDVNGCFEIVNIVTSESDWNNQSTSCPSDFDDGQGGNNPYIGCPCAVPNTDLLVSSLSVNPQVVVTTNCQDCVNHILGCTDATASNYDPTATLPDGSCYHIGCPFSSADNYNAAYSDGCGTPPDPLDGSCCDYKGCNDAMALNNQKDCLGNDAIPTSGGNLITDNTCCYYGGCTDSDADNYDGSANGCYWPVIPGGALWNDCCDYKGCTDVTADNYAMDCTQIYNVWSTKGKLPTIDCNCVYTVEGCMDDGCCVATSPDPMYTSGNCPNGTHLCPQTPGGLSYDSSFPSGCVPGINCQQSTNYDPAAQEQSTAPTTCTYPVNGVNGYVCQLNSNTSLNECVDMYAAGVQTATYPCTDAPSCVIALQSCQSVCTNLVLDDCSVFFNDREGRVYSYDPTNPDTMTFLFQEEQFNEEVLGYGTGSYDIANTENKLWLYSCHVVDATGSLLYSTDGTTPLGIIKEYDIDFTGPTFTVGGIAIGLTPLNPPATVIDISTICQTEGYDPGLAGGGTTPNGFMTLGAGMAAKNDTEIVFAGEKILNLDVTNPVSPVVTEMFSLPSPSYPSIDGVSGAQGRCTGDILIDPITNNLIVNYSDELLSGPNGGWNGKIGKFSNGGGGAPMGYYSGAITNWTETTVQSYPLHPYLFGTFRYYANGNWYAVEFVPGTGQANVYVFSDVNTLAIDFSSPINTVGLLETIDYTPYPSIGDPNPVYGASQRPGCFTITNDDGCTDPLALNYDPNATADDGSCIYPVERIKNCLPRLTKEEFLMNVSQKPETRSDVFIERGKVSVFERPQRLSQISTIGELEIHGYGYYNIITQD
tara:strand:- start:3697 stop:6507 length:2811 start_codon:yes stop_codon:yes gene_type:complete